MRSRTVELHLPGVLELYVAAVSPSAVVGASRHLQRSARWAVLDHARGHVPVADALTSARANPSEGGDAKPPVLRKQDSGVAGRALWLRGVCRQRSDAASAPRNASRDRAEPPHMFWIDGEAYDSFAVLWPTASPG